MRRPDVFTLDYSHPLAQGLVLASMLRRGRDESLRNLHGAIVNIPDSSWYLDPEIGRHAVKFSGGTDHIAHPYKLSAVDFGSGGTYAAWLNFGTPSTDEYNGSWNAPRVYLGKQGSTHVFGWGSSFGYGVSNAATPNTWTHLALTNNGSLSTFYVNGLQIGTLLQSFSGTQANNFGIGLCIGVGRPMRGPVSDTVLYNRPLSPAEIAILADRTDPMLGGLIVEERPVLYFDMGGSTNINGPLAITTDSSLGLGGVRGAKGAVFVSNLSDIEAGGVKQAKGATTFLDSAQFVCAGVLEESDDKIGPAVFVNESAVGIGGIKKIFASFGISHASDFGVGGTSGVLMPELSQASGAAISSSEISGSVYTNKNTGTLYAVATLSSTKPSVAQIQAGQNHLGASAAYATSQDITTYGTQSVLADSLSSYTQYYWHFQHKDAEYLDSTVITSSAIRTLDISIPLAFSDTAPATLLGVQVWDRMPTKEEVENLYSTIEE